MSAVLGLVCAGAALPVEAAPPTIISQSLDTTFYSARWTRRCGFPVYIRDVGTFTTKLYFSQDMSTVVSEIDTSPGYKTTWFSPATVPGGTGGSYTSPGAVALRTLYPQGVYLGAPAILEFNGLQLLAPGQPQAAGRDVYEGVVALIVDGIPLADLVEPVSTSGNFSSFTALVAAVCGAIAAP